MWRTARSSGHTRFTKRSPLVVTCGVMATRAGSYFEASVTLYALTIGIIPPQWRYYD